MFNEIKEQFDKVIAYSQGIAEPQTDELFAQWMEAKRDIIEAFGGKLIYEVPYKVNFALDDTEKQTRVNDFIDTVHNTFCNYELAEFLDTNTANFFDNIVKNSYIKDTISIPAGMRLVKAFKFFEKDKSTLEAIQNRASQVIQEDKIEGTLCFSVHPLDFLSVSENTHNWRSCHALDGEYRAGNLSYMVDKSTIVCYLKSADDVSIPMFPEDLKWNSKKWRVLLYLSDRWDMFFAGRQYPFATKNGLDKSFEILKQILHISSSWPLEECKWQNIYVDSSCGAMIDYEYLPIRGELHKLKDIVQDGETSLQFNDLLRSSCYHHPYYAIRDNVSWMREDYGIPHFTVGGAVKCLQCGKHYITNPETMMCDDCELEYGHEENEIYGTCDCCGARIVRDDAISVGYYDLVCESCYQTECFVCDCCDEVFYKSDQHYDKEHEDYVCTQCYEERRERI